ncbi:MAG: spore cortex-lytic enzyme SleB [Clostridiales bacterium]|nr:spore cortex-lytic enzyme SleB [Clostridiales bacterium]
MYKKTAIFLIILLIISICNIGLNKISRQNIVWGSNTDTSPNTLVSDGVSREDDINLLARAIHAESKGEPYEGQVAVGAVILNRVKDAKFPNTLPGVIYQPGAFEPVDRGTINEPANETAYKAALDAINGWDPTGGALYFWNPSTATSPWIWSRTIIIKIGNHVFGN